MKEVVLKLEFYDGKVKQKAMQKVAGLVGIESVAIDNKYKKLTVVGDIDPVKIVSKLRKLCHTDIVSVGPAKEPKDDLKKGGGGGGGGGGDNKKNESKGDAVKYPAPPPLAAYQQHYLPAYHQHCQPRWGGPGAATASSSGSDTNNKQQKVCFHWRAGKCSRYPCPYLHRELPSPQQSSMGNGAATSKRPYGFSADDNYAGGGMRRNPNFNNSWGRQQQQHQQGYGNRGGGVIKKTEKLCNFWVQGNCSYGDKCRYLHSWSTGDCFSLLTQLEGHEKVVTGIALPSGSDRLYSGSKDETVRVWDCQSGQCAGVISLGGEIGCMRSEGPWVFVGLTNFVRAWNTQTTTDLSLSGPVGQVYALVVGNDLLFAGVQDGTILAWKFNTATNSFEPAASLKGHNLAVVTLVVGANRLYSGSMDHSIRVWSLETLQCLQTLTDHSNVVMSVLCWDQFLLSCSLDKTVKVWAATELGSLEVTYTHNEEHGLLTLCGMHDLDGKPVLLCSCNDNCIRVYDLPSFCERGKIFAKQEVRSIQTGPPGLFFTGDGTGQVKVWQWSTESTLTK